MHSYEDRIRAVELYFRYGKRLTVVVRELGYPSVKQLGRWVRIFEEYGDLPRELKPRKRYSHAQKVAAVEHYLTRGGSALLAIPATKCSRAGSKRFIRDGGP